jgi:putative RNA 2'-phosphotransferase
VPKKNRIKTDNLSRLMVFILGHRPDEFGLVPDSEGFVTYKDLLWAIHEEPGWGYVRQGHINEVLVGKDRALFQPGENRIRALERHWQLEVEIPSRSVPRILLVAVKRRAHPIIMEKGLAAPDGKYLVLSPDQDMAMRIGRRRDQRPVLLEIMVSTALKERIPFYAFGNLFITPRIPARLIKGPPISHDDIKAPREKTKKIEDRPPDFEAGTFALDISRDPDPNRRAPGKKRKGWKEGSRKIRREKRKG